MTLLLLALATAHADDLLPPPGGYDEPMLHMGNPVYGQLLVDRMEAQVAGLPAEALVDAEGWLGTDRTRLRYRLEAEGEPTALAGEADGAVLVGQLFAPFWELQGGMRGLARRPEEGEAGAEGSVFVGVEGAVPYDFELETLVAVGHRGRVSAVLELEKDVRFSQRLILQLRAEGSVASQDSTALGTRAGLQSVGTGARLRLEAHRQLAPYLGVAYTLSPPPLGGEEGVQSDVFGVGGLRWWL